MRGTLVFRRLRTRWGPVCLIVLAGCGIAAVAHAQELLTDDRPAEAQEELLAEPNIGTPENAPQELMADEINLGNPHLLDAKCIVIDPGHGGDDPGATGASGVLEKDVTLSVSLELERILKEEYGGKVILTRREDRSLPQGIRAGLANRAGGDLLIGIHVGASSSQLAQGFELFVQAPVAMTTIEGMRPQNRDQSIASDHARLEPSRRLAISIAESLHTETGAQGRGIRQIPSVLLNAVEMPGLLIEVGCLTNETEEMALDSETYRKQVARGIATGILRALDPTQGDRP